MIEIKSTGQAKDWRADREPLFSIDGVEFTVPRQVPTNVGLKAMRRVAELGEAAGTQWLMVFILGQDGWDALEKCDDLTRGDLEAIQTVVREKVFGSQEEEGKG
jgi:hypothetical protein